MQQTCKAASTLHRWKTTCLGVCDTLDDNLKVSCLFAFWTLEPLEPCTPLCALKRCILLTPVSKQKQVCKAKKLLVLVSASVCIRDIAVCEGYRIRCSVGCSHIPLPSLPSRLAVTKTYQNITPNCNRDLCAAFVARCCTSTVSALDLAYACDAAIAYSYMVLSVKTCLHMQS